MRLEPSLDCEDEKYEKEDLWSTWSKSETAIRPGHKLSEVPT